MCNSHLIQPKPFHDKNKINKPEKEMNLFCPLLCQLHPTLGLAPDGKKAVAVPGFASAHQVPLAFKARILKLTFIDVFGLHAFPHPSILARMMEHAD